LNYSKAIKKLREIDKEIVLITHIAGVLDWDQESVPPAGVDERAVQLGWLEKKIHLLSTSNEMGELLSSLGADEHNPEGSTELTQNDRALVRILFTNWNRERKLDASFVQEFAETTSRAHGIWAEARKSDDFSKFSGTLQHIVDLIREKSSRYGFKDDPYDPLLDTFEPGTTTAEVVTLFSKMRDDLLEVLDKMKGSERVDDSFLYQKYPQDKLESITHEILGMIGFDFNRGGIGKATHPYTTSLGADDIRITNRYTEPSLAAPLFTALHEGGHALYEQGSSHALTAGSSLSGGASFAFHESQSRLWENIIGRGKAFWSYFYPRLSATFSSQLSEISLQQFLRAINTVEPTFIRTEADEVTYGLHIILRFELERALLSGSLEVKDLPEAWNDRMVTLLGIRPSSNRKGVLQDVHWSMGEFGYFPTYAMGNLYGAQIYQTMAHDIDIESLVANGQLTTINEWLHEHVYKYGSIYEPKKLLEKISGRPLDTNCFAEYLKNKYLRGGLL